MLTCAGPFNAVVFFYVFPDEFVSTVNNAITSACYAKFYLYCNNDVCILMQACENLYT